MLAFRIEMSERKNFPYWREKMGWINRIVGGPVFGLVYLGFFLLIMYLLGTTESKLVASMKGESTEWLIYKNCINFVLIPFGLLAMFTIPYYIATWVRRLLP
jgi:hypothetical protein